MRTDPGTCRRKARYTTGTEAACAAARSGIRLTPYRCSLCRDFHLTSRTKGMFVRSNSAKTIP